MNCKFLTLIFLFIFFVLISPSSSSKKVVIHVPYKVKNVKHTHTIYKIIPHHEEKNEHEQSHEHENYDFFRR
ncbi:hypothetical protein HZH68_000474 [Vespula germanica]|uniref:Uncharacterized protein n=1 Tax=Vespula germanica TaxID=30212 RepID=A0A834NTN7_VESGE|nr:hypothetical protein HZH68_000474 [Vespula germanica]